jgi:hypothetical protein
MLGRTFARIAPDWSLRMSCQREFDRLRRSGDLRWRTLPPMRHRRVESAIAAAGDRILVVAGYGNGIDEVLEHIDVFDTRRRRWLEPIDMPRGSASTHLGCTLVEDRWLCIAGGQVGRQCAPATDAVRVLDLDQGRWSILPPLPEPRYAPTLLHAHGRLHAIGGTGPERPRSRDDHWSLGVEGGAAIETAWRPEAPIPKAGIHRGGVILDGDLFVFGGQIGDVRAIPGDPAFTCDLSDLGGPVFGDSFRYRREDRTWTSIAPIPTAVSHTDTSVTRFGRLAIVVGGAPATNLCGDLVQAYDPDENRWFEIGRLPKPMKNVAAIAVGGILHLFGGQTSLSRDDLRHGRILRDAWAAPLGSRAPRS